MLTPPRETPEEPADEARALPEVSRRREALINGSFAYIGLALTIVQGIVLVPLYVHYVPMTMYGAWLATGNVLAWLELVDPGLSIVLQQRLAFAYGARKPDEIAAILGTGISIALIFAMIPLLGWPLASRLGVWLSMGPAATAELSFAFKLGLAGTAVTLAAYAFMASTSALQLTTSSGVISIFASVVGVVVTIVLLQRGFGIASLPAGLLLRGILLALLNGGRLFLWTRRHLHSGFSYSRSEAARLRQLLAMTFVLRLGGALLERVDAFLAARLVSPGAAARYTLNGRSTDVTRTAVGRVAVVLAPGLAHLAGEGDSARVASVFGALGRYHGWCTAICIGGVVALNEAFVTLWVGHDLYGGQMLTIFQAFSGGVWILTTTMYQAIIATGHVRAISLLTLVEAGVRLPLQLLLVHYMGIAGLALGASLTLVLITFSYLMWFSARQYDVGAERPSRDWLRALLHVGLLTAVGAALHTSRTFREAAARSWFAFAIAATAVGAALTLLVLALDPAARAAATVARHRIATRLRRPAPSG